MSWKRTGGKPSSGSSNAFGVVAGLGATTPASGFVRPAVCVSVRMPGSGGLDIADHEERGYVDL